MEAVKSMIHDQDLPMHLWAEATKIAVYVQNWISHSALGNKTPEKMFNGKNLKISHLKIFGCPIYIHVPKEKRSKLDFSRRKGIFVGYSDQSKSCRVYIPAYDHINIRKDVTFDEDANLNKSKNTYAYEDHEEEHEA